jgi:hypothetical protein
MENQRDDLIIVFSGAKNKLERFFDSNPGVSSRIGNHVDFADYNVEELMQITKFLLHNENRYRFNQETLEVFEFYISQLVTFPAFANVRTIKIFYKVKIVLVFVMQVISLTNNLFVNNVELIIVLLV